MRTIHDVVNYFSHYFLRKTIHTSRPGVHVHLLSSSLNFWSAILHSKFSFRVCSGHFTIVYLSRKVSWAPTSELWFPHSLVCALGFLRRIDRPFAPPYVSSWTYSKIRNTRLYICLLYRSGLNHLSLILMMIDIICDELMFIFSIITTFRGDLRTDLSYSRIPYCHVPLKIVS